MTQAITRHPDTSTLLTYAAGGLCEPLAAATAAHLALCSRCLGDVRNLELLGGAVLDAEVPAMADTPLARPERPTTQAPPPRDDGPTARASDPLPDPIARRYDITLAAIPWKRLAPGVMHHRLALSPGVVGDLRLLKIAAGARMPEHGHGGSELTLVLDGAYVDATGRYRRGDVQDVGDDIEHRPIADNQTGCICLIASERPARFTGLLGRLMQPWTGL